MMGRLKLLDLHFPRSFVREWLRLVTEIHAKGCDNETRSPKKYVPNNGSY